LIGNIKAVFDQMMRVKPQTVKGVYMRNVAISSTMSPGIKISADSIAAIK
jgi:large subunit ribosomal protein L1